MNLKVKKIFIANDHAGFQLKNSLISENQNCEWEDLGTYNEDKSDYTDQAEKLCKQIQSFPSTFGILICGSGQGMAMKANRFPGIRAALVWNEDSTRLAREHNDANVLCLGARLISLEEANIIFKTFMETPFKEGRHLKRVKKLDL